MANHQLWQFLVPLTFLALWALTKLFNSESQPLPPRAGLPPDPNGFGPVAPAPRPAVRPPARREEGVLILGPEVRRPAAPRRPARPKAAPTAAQSKRPAVAKPRTLANLPMSPLLTESAESQRPAGLLHTPLTTIEPPKPPRPVALPMPSVAELTKWARSPAKLSESLIMSELLQPPVSLRRDRFGGRS